MRIADVAILFQAAAMIGALAAQEVAAPEHLRAARSKVAAEVANGNAPSLSVAVFEKDKVVWAEGFGHANLAGNTPATADTSYRLASISKPFTATAAMLLVERKLLDLDAPANRYLQTKLRAMRGRAKQITLRRLLNHTAGLPTHWNFFYEPEPTPPRERSIRDHGFAAFEPGTTTNYSNFAFGVLDHIVGRVSKKGFRDFLQEELLQPLGMRHTEVGMPKAEHHRPAVGYTKKNGAWQPVTDYGFDHDGASAIWSSANDLMRFALLQLNDGKIDGKQILAPEHVLTMRTQTGVAAGSSFGIGWSVKDRRGDLAIRHSGGMPGVSTQLVIFPGRQLAVCVLNNSGNRGATNRALKAILDDTRPPPPPLVRTPMGPPRVPRPLPKGEWRGVLAHPDGPLPVHVRSSEQDGWQIAVQDRLLGKATADTLGEDRVQVRCNAEIPVGHRGVQSYRLTFELRPTATGYAGVAYADATSVCRLPHWCELHRAEPKPNNTHRVISYNILVGFRDSSVGRFLPGCRREQKISAWLASQQPDVVALQEMNGYTAARLKTLAAGWGHAHVALLKENGYPVALTSRYPITDVQRLRQNLHHGMLRLTTGGIDYIVVHFRPHPGTDYKTAEARTATECYQQALAAGRQAIVLGDFNSIHPADARRFSAAARTRYEKWRYLIADDLPAEVAMQPLLDAGAVDVFGAHGNVPQELPLPRIDFLLASPKLAATAQTSRWLCEPEFLRWSDHPPVVADFANKR